MCLFLKGKTDTISISWIVEAPRVVVTKCNFHFNTYWKYVSWHLFCLIYLWSNLLVGNIVNNYNWKSVGDKLDREFGHFRETLLLEELQKCCQIEMQILKRLIYKTQCIHKDWQCSNVLQVPQCTISIVMCDSQWKREIQQFCSNNPVLVQVLKVMWLKAAVYWRLILQLCCIMGINIFLVTDIDFHSIAHH